MENKLKKLKTSPQTETRATSAKLLVDVRATMSKKIKPTTAKTARMTASVKFGSVTVKATAPSNAVVKRNIAAGQLALARAKTKILNPGVTISSEKGVPLFHADPNRPGLLIRILDGKEQSGKFVDGKFKAA